MTVAVARKFSSIFGVRAKLNLSSMKTIPLDCAGKIQMPLVGLGTWRAKPEEVQNAVLSALESGYKHIDTAFNYNNEEFIGETLQKWYESGKGKREDIFITTKLPHVGNRAKDVEKFLKMSMDKLQVSYLDLYLIHMPFSFHYNECNYTPAQEEDGSFKLDKENDIVGTWKELEKQVKKGLIRAIGLSNFNAEQIQRIYDAADIKPSVLQIEMHAYCQQNDLRDLCKQLNIVITAYSPLGSPGANNHFSSKYNYSLDNFPDILGHPVVQEISEKHKKTPGQILLRHHLQHGITVIPKSSNPIRIKQNIDIFEFDLTQEDMEKLDQLDRGEEGRIFDFKFFKGAEKHPEYPFKNRL